LSSLFEEFKGQGNYYSLKDKNVDSPRVLVCYHKRSKGGMNQLSLIKEALIQHSLKAFYWTKEESIS
jgi:hypothetical protein